MFNAPFGGGPDAFRDFSFGSLQIDGTTYDHDVVIDRGKISKREKKRSKQFRDDFGRTSLSPKEDIPWKCSRLVAGTGAYGRLPVMDEVRREAARHKVRLPILPPLKAIEVLQPEPKRHQRDPPRDMLCAQRLLIE